MVEPVFDAQTVMLPVALCSLVGRTWKPKEPNLCSDSISIVRHFGLKLPTNVTTVFYLFFMPVSEGRDGEEGGC